MNEETRSPKLYVAVDTSLAIRCSWCGTLESNEWVQSQTGDFCSKECARAKSAQAMSCAYWIIVIWPVILVLLVATPGATPSLEAQRPLLIAVFVALIPFLCYMFYEVREGLAARQRTPKDSRLNEGSVELSLLRRVSEHVQCPNCEQGSIDLTAVQEDMTYFCEYCNARGPIEIIRTGD